MTENKKHLAGICGLYCGTCPHYLAFRNNDQDAIDRIESAADILSQVLEHLVVHDRFGQQTNDQDAVFAE